jgi:hypothetical protein
MALTEPERVRLLQELMEIAAELEALQMKIKGRSPNESAPPRSL